MSRPRPDGHGLCKQPGKSRPQGTIIVLSYLQSLTGDALNESIATELSK